MHYNPYFPGGAIAMPQMLIDGAVEYEDGTPATESQVPFSLWKKLCSLLTRTLTSLSLTFSTLVENLFPGFF